MDWTQKEFDGIDPSAIHDTIKYDAILVIKSGLPPFGFFTQRFEPFNKKSLTYSSIIDLFPYICMLFLIVLNKN